MQIMTNTIRDTYKFFDKEIILAFLYFTFEVIYFLKTRQLVTAVIIKEFLKILRELSSELSGENRAAKYCGYLLSIIIISFFGFAARTIIHSFTHFSNKSPLCDAIFLIIVFFTTAF
jgi:hypothetical protein